MSFLVSSTKTKALRVYGKKPRALSSSRVNHINNNNNESDSDSEDSNDQVQKISNEILQKKQYFYFSLRLLSFFRFSLLFYVYICCDRVILVTKK